MVLEGKEVRSVRAADIEEPAFLPTFSQRFKLGGKDGVVAEAVPAGSDLVKDLLSVLFYGLPSLRKL